MTSRSRAVATFVVLAVLAASTVLVLAKAAPAGATVATITITSNADTLGTCPSASSCTFRQALVEANVGGANQNDDVTIAIAPGLGTITLDSTRTYNGGAGGGHNLTIDGNGATFTRGVTAVQLFNTSTSGVTTIQESTWTNGSHGFSGGGIYASGALIITDSAFTNNLSAQYGGAVFAGDFLEMHRVEFSGNLAGYDGGGFWAWTSAEVTDSTFADNTTFGSGAAGSVAVNATLERVEATSNTATQSGGAFKIAQDAQVSDVVIEDNSATACGGGLYVLGILTLSDSSFTGNASGTGNCGGGALAAATSTISNSTFDTNSASIKGGAIYGYTTTVSSTQFSANSSDLGGAIMVLGSFDVSDSSFTANVAQSNGAALWGDSGSSTLRNSTITGNIAGTNGVIYTSAGLSVAASTISGNSVTTSSAASIVRSPSLTLFGTVLDTDSTSDSLCSSAATSLGYNYANDTSCALTAAGDRQSASNDPLLSPPCECGGNTLSLLPQTGSPLVGAIPNAACLTGLASSLTADQRGAPRPNRAGGPCDIGAVQLDPTITVTVLANGDLRVEVDEFASTVTVTLSSNPVTLGTITLEPGGFGDATFSVPCGIESGVHTLTATASAGQTASVQLMLDGCTVPDPDVVVPAFAG